MFRAMNQLKTFSWLWEKQIGVYWMTLLIDNFKHKSKQNWELLEGCKWGLQLLCHCLGFHKFTYFLFSEYFVLIFSKSLMWYQYSKTERERFTPLRYPKTLQIFDKKWPFLQYCTWKKWQSPSSASKWKDFDFTRYWNLWKNLQATKKGKFSEKNHCMEFIMISSENLASFSVISSEVAEIR